jgi:hypothetical protein
VRASNSAFAPGSKMPDIKTKNGVRQYVDERFRIYSQMNPKHLFADYDLTIDYTPSASYTSIRFSPCSPFCASFCSALSFASFAAAAFLLSPCPRLLW